MEKFKNSGIYVIFNKLVNKGYIGSSTNIGMRMTKHFTLLKHNKHDNCLLQSAVNEYGLQNFELFILEFTEENLLEREQFYIDKYKPSYNLIKDVLIVKWQQISRDKLSNSRKKKFRDGMKPNCSRAVVGINILTGEVLEFETIKQAYTETNIDRSAMQRTLRGIYNQMKGYKWYYKDGYEALVKSGELLEKPEVVNQQPSIV